MVTLRVAPRWGGCPIALLVGVRLHRKGGLTTIDLAEQILRQLTEWLPERSFALCADGAYATLIGRGLPRTSVTSRTRRDAAIYKAAPPKTGKRGRPRIKGDRLPTPAALAANLADRDFTRVDFDSRGRTVTGLVWSRRVLWYSVDRTRLVTLVIVRDPDGVCPDDFFVTNDDHASGADIASRYASRWSIEICFREVKQCLGAEDRNPGRAKAPNAPPPCRSGSTAPSGLGTSRSSELREPGHPARGTRRRPRRLSSTPSRRCGARCGANELRPCHPTSPTTRKSSTGCSTCLPALRDAAAPIRSLRKST